MLFSYHLLYFCTALSLIIMLSSHYHHHKSKTFSQLTQCPFTGTLLLLWWGIGGPNHASLSLENSQHISKFFPKRPYLVRQRQQYVSGTGGGGTSPRPFPSDQSSSERKKGGGHIRYSQVFRSLIPGSRYRFTFQDVTGKVILYF